jgi:hypothetical protein
MGEDAAADGREFDAFVGAFEQRDAQLFFQLANLTAEGGLADVTGFCGAAKVPVLGDGNQILEILKIH